MSITSDGIFNPYPITPNLATWNAIEVPLKNDHSIIVNIIPSSVGKTKQISTDQADWTGLTVEVSISNPNTINSQDPGIASTAIWKTITHGGTDPFIVISYSITAIRFTNATTGPVLFEVLM